MRTACVRATVVVTAIVVTLHRGGIALFKAAIGDLGFARRLVTAVAFFMADGDRMILHGWVDPRGVFRVAVFDDLLARPLS